MTERERKINKCTRAFIGELKEGIGSRIIIMDHRIESE